MGDFYGGPGIVIAAMPGLFVFLDNYVLTNREIRTN